MFSEAKELMFGYLSDGNFKVEYIQYKNESNTWLNVIVKNLDGVKLSEYKLYNIDGIYQPLPQLQSSLDAMCA